MSSRLQYITNWQDLAHRSGYNARALARLCEVSLRQLERFTLEVHGKTPRVSLREMRMQRALELINERTPVKTVALCLAYKNAAHFSSDFKEFYGAPPSQYVSPNVAFIAFELQVW